jgi:cytochrome c-type biogenesis protein
MSPPRWLGLLALAAILLGTAPVSAADPAPDFEIFDLEGYPVRLSDFTSKGKPVLLDFMATWCSSCHVTIKEIKKVYPEFASKLEIVSIAIDLTESEESLRGYASDYGVSWRMGRDTDRVAQKYSVVAISYLVAVDARGYAVWSAQGEAFEKDIREGFTKATSTNAAPISLPQFGLVTIAILAGVASFFSPCAFPMLPGYVTYYLGLDAKRAAVGATAVAATSSTAGGAPTVEAQTTGALRRGMLGGAAAGLGILSIYGTIGGVVVIFAGSVTPYVPLLGLVVGVLLILFASLMLAGISMMGVFGPISARLQRMETAAPVTYKVLHALRPRVPRDTPGPQGVPARRLYLYGMAYGAAACGCVAPLMLAVIALGIASGPVMGPVMILLYAGAAALLMVAVTVGVAMAGAPVARKLNKYMPWINRASAIALIVVGAYLIAFWYLAWGS